MMQVQPSKIGDHEKSLLRAIAYWEKALADAPDETSRREATIVLGMYGDELLQWHGQLERIKQRGARVAVARRTRWTFQEIVFAPVYLAQLIFGGFVLSGIWIALGILLYGILWGMMQ